MNTRTHRITFALWGSIFLLGLSSSIYGTTLQRMSLATMTRSTKIIVRAKCARNSVRWDRGEIWTFTSFAVEEMWKGSVPARFSVRLLGGRMATVTSSVSGVPRFAPGEDVALFLEPTIAGDYSVVAWEEGTFRIRPLLDNLELAVTEDSATFSTFDPATRRFETSGVAHEPLAQFRARIAALLATDREGGR